MQITLRKVKMADSKLLYHLLKDRPNYANISHNKMPYWEEHIAFMESNPYKEWFIVEGLELSGYMDVGSVYITKADEIGIAVLRKYWRKGYGLAIIKEVMKECPREKYYANISPYNMGSQKLFKKLGFTTLQYTLVKK